MARRITSSLRQASFDTISNLTAMRERFDWWWVLVGVVTVVAGNLGAYAALRPVIRHLALEQGRVVLSFALLASVALVIYFGGGVLVGRMGRGHTVREPAVAAVLALAILVVLQFTLGMVNIIGLVLGAPICFGVAYLGGVVGQRWQDRIQGG